MTLHRVIVLAIVGYLILAAGVGWGLHTNQQRVDEIQASRVASCRQTYEGVRQVLRPFFPPPPRSKQQQAQLDKFNSTVDRYKARCDTQTRP